MRLTKHINESSGRTPLLTIMQLLYDRNKDYMRWMSKSRVKDYMLSGRDGSKDYFTRSIRQDRIPKDMPQEISDEFDYMFKKRYGWKPRSQSIFVTGSHSSASAYGDTLYMIFPIGKFKFLWSSNISDLWTRIEDGPVHQSHYHNFDIEQNMENFEYDARGELEYEYLQDYPRPNEDDFYDIDDNGDRFFNEEEYDRAIDEWDDTMLSWVDGEIGNRLEQYRYEREQEMENETADIMDDIVRSYSDKDLHRAIKSNNEIMLGGKEYTAVKCDYYASLITEFSHYYHWRRRPTVEDMMLFAAKKKWATDRLQRLLWNEE